MKGDRLDRIPERIYNHILEHPGADIRTMCRDIRGKLKPSDITYLQSTIRIMAGKGLIEPEGKGWKAVPDLDFMTRYYAEGRVADQDDIYDYLVQMRRSSTAQIDRALGYDSIRGSYPTLIAMERAGRIRRTHGEDGSDSVWQWEPVE